MKNIINYKRYMKACGNNGVKNPQISLKYTALFSMLPLDAFSHFSTGFMSFHAFVTPIQGVESGFAKLNLLYHKILFLIAM
ncbi:hypothetical protein D1839_00895 [Roseburia sp. 1XD42-34]|nr:hypothetical protein [Roseburia sp. 1XD42-34]RKI82475.1 hypothetical protein D7V87_00895 [Clostridium sp. 1xD42-85]